VWPRPALLANTATPAKFIDVSIAPDAETAEKQVAEDHKVREAGSVGSGPGELN
jgi:hypothetical protein